MGWSLKLGRWLGVDVYVHFTFLILLAFLVWAYGMEGGIAEAVWGLVFTLALFACVTLHEFGHSLAARAFGVPTVDITLFPFGGIARLVRMPKGPWQEIAVALAGPAVNVVIAGVLAVYLMVTYALLPSSGLSPLTGPLAVRLLAANVVLVIFNLLPAFPMDGGRVFRGLLGLWLNYPEATRIAATVGQVIAVLMGILGLFGNPMLFIIAFLIWQGAASEAAAVRERYASGH